MNTDKEREAFEKWFTSRWKANLERNTNGTYVSLIAREAWEAWQGRAALQSIAQPVMVPEQLAGIMRALKRFEECAEDCDSDGCDIGRHWFDTLTFLGLLERVRRSPAIWEMTKAGEALLSISLQPHQPADDGWIGVARRAADALAYAAFNLDGSKLENLPIGIVESTGAAETALIAERELRAMLSASVAMAVEPTVTT